MLQQPKGNSKQRHFDFNYLLSARTWYYDTVYELNWSAHISLNTPDSPPSVESVKSGRL